MGSPSPFRRGGNEDCGERLSRFVAIFIPEWAKDGAWTFGVNEVCLTRFFEDIDSGTDFPIGIWENFGVELGLGCDIPAGAFDEVDEFRAVERSSYVCF